MLGVETAPVGVHRAGLSLVGTTYALFGVQCLWMPDQGPQRPCRLMVGQQGLAVQAGVGGHLPNQASEQVSRKRCPGCDYTYRALGCQRGPGRSRVVGSSGAASRSCEGVGVCRREESS